MRAGGCSWLSMREENTTKTQARTILAHSRVQDLDQDLSLPRNRYRVVLVKNGVIALFEQCPCSLGFGDRG